MEIYFFLPRIILITGITLLLIFREKENKIDIFPQQTWSVNEVLPIYWIFILISISSVIFYKTNPSGHTYDTASYLLTFLAVFILFFAAKKITDKRKILSISAIGAKSSDIIWILLFTSIQFCALSIFLLYEKNSIESYSHVIRLFGHFSIALVFWPIIESVLYLGMMLIPTTRRVGVVNGIVIISLLQALSHFNDNTIDTILNFTFFGLIGCYLYIKIRRIIVPLLLHSAINFLILLREIKLLS
jgi:membrane protease YdiL (CAAX protease family)